MSKSKEKCMVVCVFGSHKDWVPAGHRANQYYYTEILERMWKRVMRVHPNIMKNWICHHNGLAHSTLCVEPFLISKCITVMLQPLYSPDLAHCESFLFQKVKSAVKGHHFEFTEDIQRNITQVLNDTLQGVFQGCYSGSTAGKSVWRHKGCTLKVTTLYLMNK